MTLSQRTGVAEINTDSLVFQIPTASKDAYKKSFFPQTIRDWNVLPDSLISSAELSDDCVSKFTSLVKARDLSSSANPLVRYCHFGVSPVNYSDSDSNMSKQTVNDSRLSYSDNVLKWQHGHGLLQSSMEGCLLRSHAGINITKIRVRQKAVAIRPVLDK